MRLSESGLRDLEPDTDNARRRAADQAAASLRHALERAWWALLWERLWPALASIATALGLFLALSWAGLWLWLPPVGRAIGLLVMAVITAAAAVPLLSVRLPTDQDRLRRLDARSGVSHRPATALVDEMATAGEDAWSRALWHAHVQRTLLLARAFKAGLPMPHLAARDPLALRALVLLLAVATFCAAGGERMRRVTAAFDWQGVVVPPNFRLDAWVSPPSYTGRPPVILPGLKPGEPAMAAAVSVPVGSELIVRASGKARFEIVVNGGLAPVAERQQPVAAGTDEHRYTITGRGTVAIRGIANDDIAWAFNAVPDRAPVVALTKDPEPQVRGALQLTYRLEDDYGVVDARARFALAPQPGGEAARRLYDPPEFSLVLPQMRTRNGVGTTMKDLTEHPYAGADVTMTLTARDDAGNVGNGAPVAFTLPERVFVKPLARALIEQRRALALDADARDRVLIALDALAIEPARFTPEASVYLGLRAVFWSLAQAGSDDDLRAVVQRLWAMATRLEDGNVSDAEAALRQAQDALRQALERGANEQELRKLMEDLRAALDKFLQALAEEMRKNPQSAQPHDRGSSRQLRAQDLKNMIDKLEQLARSGAKDAARAMLDQLQQMLENLQTARSGQMNDGADDMAQLDELGDVIRKQQQLRDRTFKQGQEQRQRGRQGQQGQQGPNQDGQAPGGQQDFGDLRQNQQALRDRLNKLMEELARRGLNHKPGGQDGRQPGAGEHAEQFGRAGEAMGDAEGALREGNADGAVDSQGRALDALRTGAQSLAQQLQQGQGMGPRNRDGQARAQDDSDPLGRPKRGRNFEDGSTVKVPGEIDVQRARRILEELRKRFGETFRPQPELDYIERLLKDY